LPGTIPNDSRFCRPKPKSQFSRTHAMTSRVSSIFNASVVRLAAAFSLAAVVVFGAASAWAGPPVPAYIYGIDNINDIYEIDPIAKTSTLVLAQPAGISNSLAYDTVRNDLFFIGPDLKLKYWSRESGTTVGNVDENPVVAANNANNAAFYNNAYWFFDFNSNVLNKISLSYSGTGATAVPSISSTQTFSIAGMDLPNAVDPVAVGLNTNTFGDIAIDANTGILYASTTRGRFYSLNLTGDPTNTFSQLGAPIATSGTENTVGLQLAFNTDYSVLYGHSYETGDWYEVGLADGARTSIAYATAPSGGKGFRDLGGAAITAVPEPSTVALACVGAGGLAWRVLRRRRLAA
jgi:hypothetical protein